MRKKLTLLIVPVVLGVIALSAVSLANASSANHRFSGNVRMTFTDKTTTSTLVDADHSGGPSIGDYVVFQSDLLDLKTGVKDAGVAGVCTFLTAAGDLSDCNATGTFAGGQIRVGGPSTSAKVNTTAVTGGTGIYRHVSGTLTLVTNPDGTTTDTLDLAGVLRH